MLLVRQIATPAETRLVVLGRVRERVFWPRTPKLLRDKVWDRDHGVCALCQRDTAQTSARLQQRLDPFRAYGSTWPEEKRAMRWHKFLGRLKLARGMCGLRHLWEADHVIPVCWGGQNTLENLRTLCVCCHKKETRALARSRAAKRQENVLVAALVTMMWFSPGEQLGSHLIP